MEIKEKLLSMRETIDTIKADRSKLEGKFESVMQQLKDEFDVDSLKKAEKLYEEIRKEEKELADKLQDMFNKLEQDYEWE